MQFSNLFAFQDGGTGTEYAGWIMYGTDDNNKTYTSYMCGLAVNDLNMLTDTAGINPHWFNLTSMHALILLWLQINYIWNGLPLCSGKFRQLMKWTIYGQ